MEFSMRSGALWLALLSACASSTSLLAPVTTPAASTMPSPAPTTGVALLSYIDLPRIATTRGLSGTAWEESTHTLYAIQDKSPSIVPIKMSADFGTATVGKPITLTGRPVPDYDGEGLCLCTGGFIAITAETVPMIERFDSKGVRQSAVPVPEHFKKQASGNKGLESLALSPSGKYLFAANEAALPVDGKPPSKTEGTMVRILRHELDGAHAEDERAYRTEPLGLGTGGDMGVSEIAALSDDSLLVMERGYQSDFGNTVRIYRVDLSKGQDVVDASLSKESRCLEKTLLVDLGSLPAGAAKHVGTEPNPILDNYEGLSLGPTLPDGRRVLFVTSDDNGSDDQMARILVLAIPK